MAGDLGDVLVCKGNDHPTIARCDRELDILLTNVGLLERVFQGLSGRFSAVGSGPYEAVCYEITIREKDGLGGKGANVDSACNHLPSLVNYHPSKGWLEGDPGRVFV